MLRSSLPVARVALGASVARAQPAPPTVATKALLRSLGRDRRALAAMVDRAAGVAYVDHFEGPSGEGPAPREALLCGRALDRQLKVVRGWLFAQLHDDAAADLISCTNRGGPPRCTFGATMEWDPAVHLQFRVDPVRGLVLAAILVDDEVLVDGAAVEREHRAQAAAVARLTARRCAP